VVVAKNQVAVDWLEYFDSIRAVCPWSYPAYSRGEIEIVKGSRIRPLTPFRARVYLLSNWSPRRIKKLATKLANEDDVHEWLWSHPRYGKYSSPVGCLIQQDQEELNKIRSKRNASS